MLAVAAGLFLLLAVAVSNLVGHLGEGVVVAFLFGGVLGVALREDAVGLGVALGAVEVLIVLVVELLVGSQSAELVEDGVEAGLEAVLEV